MFKNLTKIFIFHLLIILSFSNVFSDEKLISDLKKGQKIIFIRHAIAPGSGDPENFNLNDCNTQRNLDYRGIEQSKKIGLFFIKNDIPIDIVLSSEWCRCKDTAKFAFQNFKTFDALNSFFSPKFQKNKQRQIIELSKYLNNWQSEKNLILVTHYVVILEKLNKAVSSGEIVVVDKNLNLIGSIKEY
ncbi:MAG: histidine phosphatase family protein [Pelagibacteraceae bacterium TMED237]|nr:MAG: histidine phosphatase family protein [Pelagibacteraceae bacterium TMED237]